MGLQMSGLFQAQVAIADMPINLVFRSDGVLAFVRVAQFKALIDMAPTPDGVGAEFYDDGFTIADEEYAYNTLYAYKEIPGMLAWLMQQRLQ
jgi:hypothetical protein